MNWLFINPTDITTVNITQEVFTQDSSLNYTQASTALQSNVQVDIQPVSGRFAEAEGGGAFRMTHRMFSDVYTNVQSFWNAGGRGQVLVAHGTHTYEVHQIKDWTTHLEYNLEERL